MELIDGPQIITPDLMYRGELSIVAGAPSAGKSRLTLHKFYGLATGTPGWWGQTDPLNVLYCSQRDWRFNSVQLRSLGIEKIPDNYKFLCVRDLTASEHNEFRCSPTTYISKHILNKFEADAIALDVLYDFFPARQHRSFNDYNSMNVELEELSKWVKGTNAAVDGLHHASKTKENAKYTDPMDRILGSQAILAAACSAAVLEKVLKEDGSSTQFVSVHYMSHLGFITTPRYFDSSTFKEIEHIDVMMGGMSSTIPDKLGKTEKKVLEEIPYEKFVELNDLSTVCSEKFGITKAHLYNVIYQLEEKKYVTIRTNEVTDFKEVSRARIS